MVEAASREAVEFTVKWGDTLSAAVLHLSRLFDRVHMVGASPPAPSGSWLVDRGPATKEHPTLRSPSAAQARKSQDSTRPRHGSRSRRIQAFSYGNHNTQKHRTSIVVRWLSPTLLRTCYSTHEASHGSIIRSWKHLLPLPPCRTVCQSLRASVLSSHPFPDDCQTPTVAEPRNELFT